jgi:hypothetical protein
MTEYQLEAHELMCKLIIICDSYNIDIVKEGFAFLESVRTYK